MCILIGKPANVKLPDIDTLHTCYINNPDGMGFAVPGYVFKTLDFSEFYHAITSVDENLPMIIHFRLATHGSVTKANCHPFRDDLLGVSFAHNGILPIKPTGDMTDSETAFRELFVPAMWREYNCHIRPSALDKAVRRIIGHSKFAFLDDDGELKTYGAFINDGGVLYSNTTYKTYRWHHAMVI